MRLFAATFLAIALATSAQAQAPKAAAPKAVGMAVPANAMLSYNLVGLNVVNNANDTIGEIKDLILSQGRLAGYVLSVGGFLKMGERYVAVPPSAVNVSFDQPNSKWLAKMNATADQLKASPEFKYDGRFKR